MKFSKRSIVGLVVLIGTALALIFGLASFVNALGLKLYVKTLYSKAGLPTPEIQCQMETAGGRSREGYCISRIALQTLPSFVSALALRKIDANDPKDQAGRFQRKRCESLPDFKLGDIYVNTKALPMPENTRTSFERMFFNVDTGAVCFEVSY